MKQNLYEDIFQN